MINKTHICRYNRSNLCLHPNAQSPTLGPDGLFKITEYGCREKICSGYLAPQHAKEATPVFRVEVAHSPLTVPSVGPSITYYVAKVTDRGAGKPVVTFNSSEIQYPLSGVAVTNLLSEYYDESHYPPMLTVDRSAGDKWGCLVSGFFQGQKTGTHYFYVAGEGDVYLNVNSTVVLSGSVSRINYKNGSISLSSGVWYAFNFKYKETRFDESGYTVLFDSGDGKIPMSAGTCTSFSGALVTGEMPLDYYEVPHVINVSLTEADKNASIFTFSVPMSSTSGYGGYSYNLQYDRLDPVVSSYNTSYLKKGELIKYNVGFYSNSYNDTVCRFVGHITDINSNLSPEDEPVFEITCMDFSSMTVETISKNYPTIQSYWLAGMLDDSFVTTGYKLGTPAFDSWYVSSVFKTLLMHCGIDPILMVKKYEFTNRSGVQVIGTDYLIAPVSGANKFPQIALERATQYGNYENTIAGGVIDSTYHFKYGFGEAVADIINELSDNFGFKWGFRGYNEGAPYLMTVNTPSRFKSAKDLTRSNWSTPDFHINAIEGSYSWSTVSGGTIYTTITGTAADVVCPTSDIYISGSQLNVKVTRVSDSVIVSQYNLSTKFTPWHYYNGIAGNIGYNPTYFKVASGLPYDIYEVKITNIASGSQKVFANAILSYERDNLTPLANITVIRSAENVYPGNIISFDYTDSSSDMRNDVVVVGKSKGMETRGTEFNEQKYFYVGRGIDVQSIYNPNAINYIGRYRSGMVVSNRIASDERANFMAFSILSRLRNPGKKCSFEVQGNPFIEVHDPFVAIDEQNDIINDRRWITSIITGISDNNIIKSSIESQDFEPYGSYIKRPRISYSGHGFVTNVSVENRGCLCTSRDTINLQNPAALYVTDISTLSGVVPLVSTSYPDNTKITHYANCYYVDRRTQNVPGGTMVDYIANKSTPFVISGYGNDYISIWASWGITFRSDKNDVLIPYDPYYSEPGQDTFVNIIFDILDKCKLRIEIFDFYTGILVATLSGDPKADHPDEKIWDIVDIGKHMYTWGGYDQYGEYNKSCTPYNYSKSFDDDAAISKGNPEAGMFVSEYVHDLAGNQLYGKFVVQITAESLEDGNIFSERFLDQPIYTRRGASVFDNNGRAMVDIMFHTDRLKFISNAISKLPYDSWTGNPYTWYQYITGNRASILDTDNNKNGLGIKLFSYPNGLYSAGTSQSNLGAYYYVPRLITYKILPKYYKLTGMTAYEDPGDPGGTLDSVRVIAGGIFDGPEMPGELFQFKQQSTYMPATTFGDSPTINLWKQIYFSPLKQGVVYQTQAAQFPTNISKRGILEWFAWCVELTILIQDVSGRNIQRKEYFQWFGQKQYSPYDFLGATSYIDPDENIQLVSINTAFNVSNLYTMNLNSTWFDPNNPFKKVYFGNAKNIIDRQLDWLEESAPKNREAYRIVPQVMVV